MDVSTANELQRFGIDPTTVPEGTVSLLSAGQYRGINVDTRVFAQNPLNAKVLAYEVETEHKRAEGLVLRNLFSSKETKAHLTVTESSPPLWHNFTPALPRIWETGVVVLVEGPKDARVLWSLGVLNVVAYLSSVPSRKHLKCLSRYASVIVWVPDNDPVSKEKSSREMRTEKEATKQGLWLRKVSLRYAKDPGDLGLEKYMEEREMLVERLLEMTETLGGWT